MNNTENLPPRTDIKVDDKRVVEGKKVTEPNFSANHKPISYRPLPEVDQNELHCILEPFWELYPGQNPIVPAQNLMTREQNLGLSNSGLINSEG